MIKQLSDYFLFQYDIKFKELSECFPDVGMFKDIGLLYKFSVLCEKMKTVTPLAILLQAVPIETLINMFDSEKSKPTDTTQQPEQIAEVEEC